MERSVLISKELLKFQMGMPITENIEIGEEFEDLEFDLEEILALESDFNQRIEYSQLETNKKLTELDLKNNQVQYLPNLDLIFSWGMNSGPKEPNELIKFGKRDIWSDYMLVGIKMHMPIFDGLLKAKKIQQNKIQLNQIMYQRSMLENSINLEVEQSRKNLVSSLESLENQKENMTLAEEVYNHSKIKYQEGVGSNLEVIDADNAFKDAQSNYFSALYDALISHVEYQKALGILYQETHND
jgi:outer membrane protein TolC